MDVHRPSSVTVAVTRCSGVNCQNATQCAHFDFRRTEGEVEEPAADTGLRKMKRRGGCGEYYPRCRGITPHRTICRTSASGITARWAGSCSQIQVLYQGHSHDP